MHTVHFEVRRIDVVSDKPFEKMVSAFEQRVPVADTSVFDRLTEKRAGVPEIERAVESMAGDLGFMVLRKLDQGPFVSLLGKRKKMTLFLIGNPLLANKLYDRRPETGMYAPLHASIYEDAEGRSHFTYDQPSTLLRQFDDEQIQGIAGILDERMKVLADYLAS